MLFFYRGGDAKTVVCFSLNRMIKDSEQFNGAVASQAVKDAQASCSVGEAREGIYTSTVQGAIWKQLQGGVMWLPVGRNVNLPAWLAMMKLARMKGCVGWRSPEYLRALSCR